ncbi:hypothetical protein QP172_10540 [Corynebacterium coyleae]|uniref:hypothetical protein n=1 Tax=Corynebacterium coyleae TaxID=53374 RepID=UPI002549EF43|nr:hypothetical protein [Corynebacterium coyleae]MDK6494159.1 hypothetical protein [Corynebacterium coyleae]
MSTPTFANRRYNAPGDMPNVAAAFGIDIPAVTNATSSSIRLSRVRANAFFGGPAVSAL